MEPGPDGGEGARGEDGETLGVRNRTLLPVDEHPLAARPALRAGRRDLPT